MITIGRLQFADGLAAWVPGREQTTFDLGGVAVPDPSMSGAYRVSWAKAMLLSIGGLSGQTVPIVCTDIPELDGIYRVDAVNASTLPVTLADGVFDPGTITATRVAGGVARCELVLTGGARVVTAPVTAFTTGATYGGMPRWVGGSGVTVAASLTTATGKTVHQVSATSPAHVSLTFPVPVDEWLSGATTIEAQIGGLWVPIHGTQTPTGCPIRIGNDLVRVTLAAGHAVNQTAVWEQWSGTAWQPVTFTLSDTSGLVAWRGMLGCEVIRSDETEVTIRTWGNRVDLSAVIQTIPWQCVWTVRRGCQTVECTPETIPIRWNTASAVGTIYTSGADYGARILSTPNVALLASGLIAYSATAPGNVRDSTIIPSPWCIAMITPTDARAQWWRWSTAFTRVRQ